VKPKPDIENAACKVHVLFQGFACSVFMINSILFACAKPRLHCRAALPLREMITSARIFVFKRSLFVLKGGLFLSPPQSCLRVVSGRPASHLWTREDN
jgi:hypothetical protein